MHKSTIFATDVEIMEGVGGQLRRLREAQRLTVDQVARRTELNPSTVLRAEHGKNPTLLTLTRLLRCYGALDGLTRIVPEPTLSPVAAADTLRREARG